MMNSIIYSMILTTSFIFIQMKHPLAMGLMLLIHTVLISMITGFMMKSFWFSYVLFLIFLGGMLVLFIYVTSLASNEMFSMSMKYLLTTITLFSIFLIMLTILTDNTLMNFFMKNSDFMEINNSINEMLNLNKLYNYPTNMLTIMLITYLFITLIVVVKVTKLFFGPIRMMN